MVIIYTVVLEKLLPGICLSSFFKLGPKATMRISVRSLTSMQETI